MWLKENKFSVKLGGMTFINVKTIMQFRGEPLFTVYRSDTDGSLAINFEVFDSGKNKLASVRQNRIYIHHERAKELKIGGDADTYTLSNAADGTVLFNITRRAPAETELDVSIHTYLPNGVLLDAGPNHTSLASHFFMGVTIAESAIGVNIG